MKPIAEESKSRVVAVYDGAAPTYNLVGPSFFLHFGQRLARGAGFVPASKVLDIATGTGAVLIPAAELVGANGRVIGVDISPRMIGRAQNEILQSGLRNANVLVGDAERLPFQPDSFDCVLCSFAIFLFSNLSGPISECHRVLRAGGRIGLVYSAGEDPEWNWYEQLLSKYKPTASLATERYSPDQVKTELERAGFAEVAISLEVHRLVFSNASEFWGWAWSHGDRAVLESLTGDSGAFKRELFEEFGKQTDPTGLPYHVVAAVTLATKQ